MAKINILHISDVYVQKNEETDIKSIVKKLIADIKKMQSEKDIKQYEMQDKRLFLDDVKYMFIVSAYVAQGNWVKG